MKQCFFLNVMNVYLFNKPLYKGFCQWSMERLSNVIAFTPPQNEHGHPKTNHTPMSEMEPPISNHDFWCPFLISRVAFRDDDELKGKEEDVENKNDKC